MGRLEAAQPVFDQLDRARAAVRVVGRGGAAVSDPVAPDLQNFERQGVVVAPDRAAQLAAEIDRLVDAVPRAAQHLFLEIVERGAFGFVPGGAKHGVLRSEREGVAPRYLGAIGGAADIGATPHLLDEIGGARFWSNGGTDAGPRPPKPRRRMRSDRACREFLGSLVLWGSLGVKIESLGGAGQVRRGLSTEAASTAWGA